MRTQQLLPALTGTVTDVSSSFCLSCEALPTASLGPEGRWGRSPEEGDDPTPTLPTADAHQPVMGQARAAIQFSFDV
jgi:hypothetical protein